MKLHTSPETLLDTVYTLTVTSWTAECALHRLRFTIRYDIFTCAQKLTIWPA